MPFQTRKIRQVVEESWPKLLVYGEAGVGKTRSIETLPGSVLVVSAEGGLLSLQDSARADEIDVEEIASIDDLARVHQALLREEHSYDWVAIDSWSEIAEKLLAGEKNTTRDPRKAYGAVIDVMLRWTREMRDLPIGVLVLAKALTSDDDLTSSSGDVTTLRRYSIAMPGRALGAALPYLFDEVFFVRVEENRATGEVRRELVTRKSPRVEAKDRSGRLDAIERLDYAHVVRKMRAPRAKEEG
jgi:hypothetical protein